MRSLPIVVVMVGGAALVQVACGGSVTSRDPSQDGLDGGAHRLESGPANLADGWTRSDDFGPHRGTDADRLGPNGATDSTHHDETAVDSAHRGGGGALDVGAESFAEAASSVVPDDCPVALSSSPGPEVFALDDHGGGVCSDLTVRALMAQVYALRPELTDIAVLHGSEPPGGDPNLVRAYRTTTGLALAFKRGWGDCPAGCTSNEFWYFVSDGACLAKEVGHYREEYTFSNCFAVQGRALWNVPNRAYPSSVCDVPTTIDDISGTYRVQATGERRACSLDPKVAAPLALSTRITLQVRQDPGLKTGTVTLGGTSHPLLDGVPLKATFERRRLVVNEEYSAMGACPSQHTIRVAFDLEGYQGGTITLDEVEQQDCSEPMAYCKGQLHLSFCTPPATTR